MKTYLYIIWISLLAGFSSCTDETQTGTGTSGSKDRINLYFKTASREVVRTRSSDTPAELQIDKESVYVLITSGNTDDDKLLDWCLGSQAESNNSEHFILPLAEQSSNCHAFIIANAKELISAQTANWEKGTTTLKKVREDLVTPALSTQNDVITAMPKVQPMMADYALVDGLKSGTSIGTDIVPVTISPITAKITVENKVPGNNFTLLGANLCNAPEKGYIFPDIVQSVTLRNYGKNGEPSSMLAGVTTDNTTQTTTPLFCYESGKTNNTFVIIKATYNGAEYYYRIDILTPNRKEILPLLRGYHYKVNILSVIREGYATVEDAMKNPALNSLQYIIDAEDTDSYDIITNGIQYLGVSNSEYWMYNSNHINIFEMDYDDSENITKATPFSVTTLTYTTDASWNEGRVIASDGIHLQKTDGSKSQTITLPCQNTENTPVRMELKAFFDDDFKEGNLNIQIGNLQKTIKIKRELSIDIMGNVIPLGDKITFAEAKTVDNLYTKSDATNYSLVYSENGSPLITGNGYSAIEPNNQLYLQVRNRFMENCDYCYGQIYLHRSTSEGRVKIDLAVDMHGVEPWGDYTYAPKDVVPVGTFHKNNERGERLVQIPQCNLTLGLGPVFDGGRWQARVLVGKDFIRLGEWDKNITVTENHFEGNPENRLVEGDKIYLSGNNPVVRFRIGLTSTNIGNPNRYGLIQIIYVDKRPFNDKTNPMKLSCFIFVRQGEEADNVLTPGETYTGIDGNSFTAPDVKFSPYALVDPNYGEGGNNLSDHTLLTNDITPIFAEHPSDFDYLFQWSGDRAFHPGNPDENITNWNSKYEPSEFKELCPEGYITPPAQINNIDIYNGLQCKGPFSFNNALRDGVYLDGYQDRYIQIDIKDGRNTTYNYAYKRTYGLPFSSYTSAFAENACHTGYLFFNPKTMASLYLPSVYLRHFNTGETYYNRTMGSPFWFWTQTSDPNSNDQATMMGLGEYNNPPSLKPLPKSYAARIRCIRDPNKP